MRGTATSILASATAASGFGSMAALGGVSIGGDGGDGMQEGSVQGRAGGTARVIVTVVERGARKGRHPQQSRRRRARRDAGSTVLAVQWRKIGDQARSLSLRSRSELGSSLWRTLTFTTP